MRAEDLAYFSSFLKEFQKETDRGSALVGAALIDSRLERLLRSHFLNTDIATELLNGGNAPIGAFSARIKLSYALGLITEAEFDECERIRKIRNEFAHEVHGVTFQRQPISDWCRLLRANTPDNARFGGDPRQLFINSVIGVSLALWYRPEFATSRKALARVWDYQLACDPPVQ